MSNDPELDLQTLQEELSRTGGCLASEEENYVPSCWNELQQEGVEPTPIGTPEEFTGGQYLSVVCTQTDLPARQQKELVERWCQFLPTLTGIRVLWFRSRVPQALFDASCRMSSLEGLFLKWNGLQNIDAIAGHPRLQMLHLGASASIESLAPIRSIPQLKWFQVAAAKRSADLAIFRGMDRLIGLGFIGGDGKPITVPSFEPLRELSRLEWLHIGALRPGDDSLRPLGALKSLRWLGLPNFYSVEQHAWLSTRLSSTKADYLSPFARWHRSVFPCPKCKQDCRVGTTGKGSSLLCPRCDSEKLAKHVLTFRRFAAKARSEASFDAAR